MLLMIGALALEIWPMNPTETGRSSGGDYVEKPVLGRRPPLEWVGEAAETVTITARLFPEKLGGLDKLDQLNAIRLSGVAQYVFRGDNVPLGWMVVESVSEKSTYLDAQGVGKIIDVSITLRRTDKPEDAEYHATMAGTLN